MLLRCRGRCAFHIYIPNKPSKYGTKVFPAVDAKTFYTSHLDLYAGSQTEGLFQIDDSVTAVILKKRNHISGTARNVTMDRLFTSVESVSRLLHDHRLTVIGTIRFSQKSLPKEVKNVKDEPVKSLHSVQSLFCIPCRYDTYFICPKKVKESITCTVNVHTTITK